MHSVDWAIVCVLFLILVGIAIYTKRYTLSVADFLAANRCAGRYLLAVTAGVVGFSAVTMLAIFEQNYEAGFCGLWWSNIWVTFSLIIAMSCWVIYRFRETRALTMAQMLEIRYSRKFRVFTGILHWSVGLLGYGFFPGITARLVINFCGLPSSLPILGFDVSMFPVVMFIMLGVALLITLSGGQISIMVTDFLQSQIIMVTATVIIFFLLIKFPWPTIIETLKVAPEGKSMINPLNQTDTPNFNVWFFAMIGFLNFYGHGSHMGGMGYNSAPKNPHEAKMGRILCTWRAMAVSFMLVLIPIVIYVVFHNPEYASDAKAIEDSLNSIQDEQVRIQMRVPLGLLHFLPTGMVGLFVAFFIMASVTTDDTTIHSWGSILVQDIILPLKKITITPEQHLKYLRLSIVGVAGFAFFFSLVMPVTDYLYMFIYMLGAISAGSAGSIVIGGLYWKRGTTAAAWATSIAGIILAVMGIAAQIAWKNIEILTNIAPECPLNGMQIAFTVALICIVVYVLVSLLTCKKPFNLERMLHRGQYAIHGEHIDAVKKVNIFRRLSGIDKEFTAGDKFIAISVISCTLFFILSMVSGTIYGLIYGIPIGFWSKWWYGVVIFYAVATIGTVVWFLIGGFSDMIDMFKMLKTVNRNAFDDGRVLKNHNLADENLMHHPLDNSKE